MSDIFTAPVSGERRATPIGTDLTAFQRQTLRDIFDRPTFDFFILGVFGDPSYRGPISVIWKETDSDEYHHIRCGVSRVLTREYVTAHGYRDYAAA